MNAAHKPYTKVTHKDITIHITIFANRFGFVIGDNFHSSLWDTYETPSKALTTAAKWLDNHLEKHKGLTWDTLPKKKKSKK